MTDEYKAYLTLEQVKEVLNKFEYGTVTQYDAISLIKSIVNEEEK
ncbi:hypothetical protein BPS13_0155 [Bacillus phage BPS13]|uniref:Uncharacterized protein n=1 Tax=Bacillus phage BPS13 TaxID=1136731 RepID=J9PV02_9CAUD|nr:hypothetical protein [Bacillus thuringiensis]YP_006907714.1 hypothetical protein BPS13_0155 [Bacillus phage BPS13]AEZ50334.1 hypothetical protein BPS13_0155 [Bacillus phage BPS13]